jgi:hypothetical protein
MMDDVNHSNSAGDSSVPVPVPASSSPATNNSPVAPAAGSPNASVSPKKADIVPTDIKELTIKNLDTGEQFVIGENDPDFEFDTFELRGGDPEPAAGGENGEQGHAGPRRLSYWQRFVTLFIVRRGTNTEVNSERDLALDGPSAAGASPTEFKTPFTKLSSFKLRKQLGKSCCGRGLLAEARVDGKLYALKIISKKNMRSSDKRQAKAERDILHAMGHRAPHPFTAGLKFAFQSENNLYLGMDYFPGGTLRELIKRFGCLPEVLIFLRCFDRYMLLIRFCAGLGSLLCSRAGVSNLTPALAARIVSRYQATQRDVGQSRPYCAD